MQVISEEIVDKTWQSIADMKPEDAGEAMFHFSEAQPHLLGFVMSFTDDLSDSASELSTYMMYVVYQMFANAADGPISEIPAEVIEKQFQTTCDQLEQMHEDEAADVEQLFGDLANPNQPHVYQYVSSILLEEPEEAECSEEEVGEMYLMMKCVIEAIDGFVPA